MTAETAPRQAPDLREPGTPCPVVMLILDESGSMDLNLPNNGPTHLQAGAIAHHPPRLICAV